MARVCTGCGAQLEDNELFCMKCGTPVDQKKESNTKIYCPQCGNVLAPDAMFCDVCGRETESGKPKSKKKEKAEPAEPATMEGLESPDITEDTFAGSKELRNQKFDGFEAAEDHAVKKAEEIEDMMPKAVPMFAMDSAALPERKEKAESKPKQEAPRKQQVTADTIKNSNPYGQFAAKAGGKTIQTAQESKPAPAERPAPAPKPEKQQEAPAPQPAPQSHSQPKTGFAGFIEKLKSIFTKK